MHRGKRRVLPGRFSRLSINSQRWIARRFLSRQCTAFNSSAITLLRVNKTSLRTVYDRVLILITPFSISAEERTAERFASNNFFTRVLIHESGLVQQSSACFVSTKLFQDTDWTLSSLVLDIYTNHKTRRIIVRIKNISGNVRRAT